MRERNTLQSQFVPHNLTIPLIQPAIAAPASAVPASIDEEAAAREKIATEINASAPLNRFSAKDVAAILREREWLETSQKAGDHAALAAWLARAAQLLSPHAPDRGSLTELLGLVFNYGA